MVSLKKQFMLLLLMVVFVGHGFGQVFTGISLRSEKNEVLSSKFKNYELFSLNTSSINSYVKDDNYDYQIQFNLGDKSWQLELFPNDMRSGDFVHVVGLENGATTTVKQDNYMFIGHIKNGGAQKAVFTIMDNFMMGCIRDGGEEYFIERAEYIDNSMSKNTYIVYKGSDVIEDPNQLCGFDVAKHQKGNIEHKHNEAKNERKQNKVESRRECFELDVALAADWAYVNKHGGAVAAEGYMFGILGLVAFNWDDEFADEIAVVGGTTFTSNCGGCDPWSSTTNAGALLNSFTAWGNGGGFPGGYDVATLWTDRDFNGGTVGIAWLNGICNGSRYNCCQDFTSGTNTLRQLQCHELGHNYGLPHVNGPWIMAPSVNGSNSWSGASIGRVDNNTPWGCMTECLGNEPPIADFTSDREEGCVTFFVEYEDLSFNDPTDWFWEFEGGSPATARVQNPLVEYRDKGIFQVRLTVSNSNGTDTKTSYSYINAMDVPEANFSFQINQDEPNVIDFYDQSVDAESWEWDFDDGTYSNEQYPKHTYKEDGEYYVTLRVENYCGVSEIEVFVLVITPVVAKFATDTIQGCKSFYTTFADLSSSNTEFWKWEFPGGQPQTSTKKNPRVLYDSVGVFDVFLTVKNKHFTDTFRIKNYIKVDTASKADYSDTMDIIDSLNIDFLNESENYDSVKWSFEDTIFVDDSIAIYFASLDDTLKVALDTNAEVTFDDLFHDDTLNINFYRDSVYKVTVITYQDCGNDTIVKDVIAGKLPVSDFETASTTYCQGDLLNLIDKASPNTTRWEWKVTNANGTNSYFGKNPQITLGDVGKYTITLVAKNGLGEDEVSKVDYIEVLPQTAASFDHVVSGQDVDFTSTASNATTHAWDFGDNTTSAMANPSHTYMQSGTFLVQYISTNQCNSDTVETEILIDNAPTAGFTPSAKVGCAPVDIQFENTSTVNSTSWEWSFVGGTPATSTDKSPTIRYENAGIFDVQLIAINAVGRDTIKQNAVITLDDAPSAQFNFTSEQRKVTFENKSTGSRITYEWDFGDGNKSSDENPEHEYTKDGKYNVSLKVTNNCGSITFVREVIVMTTSVNRNEFLHSLSISPNPSKGEFSLALKGQAFDEISIEVMSVFGKKIWSASRSFGSGVLDQSIDLNGTANGTYFVVLRSNEHVVVRKIVIQQ